ncbi:S8 family serine peptidase [Planomicrobium sp. CPCC 101079]|uniref:S8 family serine peptidase n=1 Tax=Planomicrobium sp. CPCC 101079 TaxID=2599618 RepID=UPI0011B6C03B|nr:S8 family serine peptidase [Planomicrobium sp. CPCC 101079]TWT03662.1 S8 family serine peptidase [Planomicrobium sp. CPCC 101079]
MKKTLAALSVLTIFLHSDLPASAENYQAETDQVIVTMEEDAVRPVEDGEVIPVEGQENQLVAVEVPDGETVDGFIEELEKRSDVERVEPDHLVKLAYTANDPYISSKQYHHQKIGTIRAWDKTFGSPEVVVAVIDDGVDMLHPELTGKFVSPYDTVKDSATAIPAGIHGTHIAGIISSSIDNQEMGAGIAPNTSIMPINVFSGEYAYTSDIIEAINYAVENGADIINMSLGSEKTSASLESAIQRAHAKGVVLVAAAGNDGVSTPNYPAAYPDVISVGSTTATDTLSDFSNYGPTIDITAPGSSIQSTWPDNSFGGMSGTSMATPVVAGVAALVMADDPELTNEAIEKRLYETAKDLGVPGKDDLFGFGRVSAKDALLLPPEKPEVGKVTDQSTSVNGKAEAGTTIAVKKGGAVVATGTATEKETFAVTIPKQQAGTKLTVIAENRFKKVSEAQEITVVDATPPMLPVVISLYNTATAIKGTAETGSTVYAYVGTGEIGKATSASGSFSMEIAKQPAGTIINLVAADAAGNKSPAAKIIVASASIKVAAATYDKLKVSWAQVSGAHGYEVYRSTSKSGTYSKVSTITSGNTLSFTNSSLTTGKTYYYKVRAYRTISGKKVYGSYTSIASGKTAVSAVAIKATSAGYDKNKISWAKVNGASGYAIYQSTSKNGTYSNIKTIGNGNILSYTKTRLTTGKKYYYKVRAFRLVNGKRYYGPYSIIASAKPTVSLASVKAETAGYNTNKINWSLVRGASGYALYQATSQNGVYSNIKTSGNTSIFSYIRAGLLAGKTYYYKARAYRTVNGKEYFDPYSSFAYATPALEKPSEISVAKAGNASLRASWNKVREAEGYELYRATSKAGKYTKIKTITSGYTTSYTNKGMAGGKTYYYKVRAYRILKGKKIYSSFTAVDFYKL